MTETRAELKEQRYRRRQRFMVPAVIIVIALLMLWWGTQTESQRVEQLESYLRQVCTLVVQGADPTSRIRADSPEKRDGFTETLRVVLADVDDPGKIGIDVAVGDTSPYADGRATHTAMISVEGRAVLGVRIKWPREEPIDVVGYWIPAGAPGASGDENRPAD